MSAIFVLALWAAYALVYLGIAPFIPEPGVRAVLLIAGALVVSFNTAAVVAMIRHYAEDKHFIYEIDLRHLDEMKAARSSRRNAGEERGRTAEPSVPS